MSNYYKLIHIEITENFLRFPISNGMNSLDLDIFTFFQSIHTPFLTYGFYTATWFFNTIPFLLLATISGYFLHKYSSRKRLYEFVIALSFSVWFVWLLKYTIAHPEVDAFLPIVIDTDEKGQFAGFTNEATFALNIAAEMGILSNETLQTYQNFQISGMVIKKSSFVDFGLLKPSFKLTFGYEFFLRMTNNSVKIMSIPKIGYKHINLREGSIFWNYKNGDDNLTDEEVRFWVESAKKEYLFINDRAIKYEPQTV